MLARVTNSLVPRRSTSLFDPMFERLFDDVLTDWRYFDRAPIRSAPGINTRVDDDGRLLCEFDVPGVSADDIEITVDEGIITVSGKRGERSFTYRFTPSADYDLDTAEAQIKDGLLTLSMVPYVRPEPKKIPIKSG
mgnify:CR=1 FL=1